MCKRVEIVKTRPITLDERIEKHKQKSVKKKHT